MSEAKVIVEIDTVLLETDLPEVAVAHDADGVAYVCALTSAKKSGLHYVAVAVSGERLAMLMAGDIDLRDVLVSLDSQPLHGTIADGSTMLSLERMGFPEEWLPEPGLFIQAGWARKVQPQL